MIMIQRTDAPSCTKAGAKSLSLVQMPLLFYPDSMFFRSIPRKVLPTMIAVPHILAIQYRMTVRTIAPPAIARMLKNKSGDCSFNTPTNQLQFSFAKLHFSPGLCHLNLYAFQNLFLERNFSYSSSNSLSPVCFALLHFSQTWGAMQQLTVSHKSPCTASD